MFLKLSDSKYRVQYCDYYENSPYHAIVCICKYYLKGSDDSCYHCVDSHVTGFTRGN